MIQILSINLRGFFSLLFSYIHFFLQICNFELLNIIVIIIFKNVLIIVTYYTNKSCLHFCDILDKVKA